MQARRNNIRRTKICFLGDTESNGTSFEEWQKTFDYRIIYTSYDRSIERKFSKKLEKTSLEFIKVVVISAKMIFIYVGNHSYHWMKITKRRVTLIGLGNQILSFTKPRVKSCAVELPSYNKCRHKACLLENICDHASGRCFAVRS